MIGRLLNLALLAVIACCLWVAAGGASDGALTERSGPKGPNAERDNHGAGRSPSQPLRSLSACGASSVTPERSTPVVTNPCADGRYQGLTARQWAKRAVQQRKNSNARGLTIRRLKAELRRRYEPSFEHYFTIASLTYDYDRATLERKGRCESVNFTDFYNETPIYNGEHAQGVMGFIPSTFASTPFRSLNVRYDHLANIMAGAWMHARGRGGEWACR